MNHSKSLFKNKQGLNCKKELKNKTLKGGTRKWRALCSSALWHQTRQAQKDWGSPGSSSHQKLPKQREDLENKRHKVLRSIHLSSPVASAMAVVRYNKECLRVILLQKVRAKSSHQSRSTHLENTRASQGKTRIWFTSTLTAILMNLILVIKKCQVLLSKGGMCMPPLSSHINFYPQRLLLPSSVPSTVWIRVKICWGRRKVTFPCIPLIFPKEG